MDLTIIYNDASQYREGIFREIEKAFNCDWHFGHAKDGIKELDTSFMKERTYTDTIYFSGGWYWQKGVQKLLRKDKIILMIGESRCLSTWVLLLRKKLFYQSSRIYFWTHGWYGKETALERLIKKIYFSLPNGIFVYGNRARKLMIEEGISEEKIHTIYNSLNYNAQLRIRQEIGASPIYFNHFHNKNKVLLFIGRLTPVKRLDLLMKAIAILKGRGEDFNAILIGDGSERDALNDLIINLGVQQQIWFYGACHNETINAELIYNADLCVAPGNVGLTAIHSMMFGCPVATHNNFAYQMPEYEAINEGKTGIFFDYLDETSMADRISEWFTSNKSRDEIRIQCYQEIDKFWNPQKQIGIFKDYLK